MIFDGFGDHFWDRSRIKIALKNQSKINQILDRFLKDFGSQYGSILVQFWLQKTIKNQTRNLKEKEPRENDIGGMRRRVRGLKNSLGEGPKNQQDTDRYRSVCFTRPAVLRRIFEWFLGPWTFKKSAFGVGEVLFFRNSHVFDQICFWTDFYMILEGLGDHFGSQNGTKMASKIDLKNLGISMCFP